MKLTTYRHLLPQSPIRLRGLDRPNTDLAYLSYTVSTVNWVGLDKRGIKVRPPAVMKDFSILHHVRSGSGAHEVGLEGHFLGV